jgi:hypothetical protein
MDYSGKFYVYGHFLLTGEVFYIGKGKGGRAYKRADRNPRWNNKVKKHGGFRVVILQDILSEELAFEVEKSFIKNIGRKNLVNMTDGGEGVSGWIPSEETRKKIGDGNRGKTVSEDTKINHSNKLKGNTHRRGKQASDETREKICNGIKHNNPNKFGCVGIRIRKNGKFSANIKTGRNKRLYLGTYNTIEEAKIAIKNYEN